MTITGRAALAAAGTLLSAAGVIMAVIGARGATEPAPLPFGIDGQETTATTRHPDVPPAGPDSANVGGVNVDRNSMGPERLLLPALGIYAPLEHHGLTDNVILAGADLPGLEIPSDPNVLTLSTAGAQCDDTTGTMLLAGHVANNGVHGALWQLANLPDNAIAFVRCGTGPATAWKQEQTVVSTKQALDQTVFATTGPHRLAIVTCAGPVGADGHHRYNLIQWFSPLEGTH